MALQYFRLEISSYTVEQEHKRAQMPSSGKQVIWEKYFH